MDCYHVYPLSQEKMHEIDSHDGCWCNPRIITEDRGMVIVHNGGNC